MKLVRDPAHDLEKTRAMVGRERRQSKIRISIDFIGWKLKLGDRVELVDERLARCRGGEGGHELELGKIYGRAPVCPKAEGLASLPVGQELRAKRTGRRRVVDIKTVGPQSNPIDDRLCRLGKAWLGASGERF